MDISLAAFGLDMRAASRIYFISPVLNPQVEAQAVGRARRISQRKPVKVETLVLRDSIEEVIVRRRGEMSKAEHRSCKTILDDGPIKNWILNSKVLPLEEVTGTGGGDGDQEDGSGEKTTTTKSDPGTTEAVLPIEDQMARLESPQYVFCRDFGRDEHPDQDLIMADASTAAATSGISNGAKGPQLPVRPHRPLNGSGGGGGSRKRHRSPHPQPGEGEGVVDTNTSGNSKNKKVLETRDGNGVTEAAVETVDGDGKGNGKGKGKGDDEVVNGDPPPRPARRVRFA